VSAGTRRRAAAHRVLDQAWLFAPLTPFALFALAFLLMPSLSLFGGSFQDQQGRWTLQTLAGLASRSVLAAYTVSIQLSLVTAIAGGLAGLALAWAVVRGGLPGWTAPTLLAFSGVASNFAGVPLAFSFIATYGRTGLATGWLDQLLGASSYQRGLSLYGFWGLSLVYLYFQIPLMVLVITPALEGLRREWSEAAQSLGASSFQFLRYVAVPVLLPSVLGTMLLLFGNAFGAYATAYALTGGTLNLAPILVGAEIRGDVLHNPNLGDALALGMIVVMGVCLAAYVLLQRRAERWTTR
jgi:putative spermidine/putrescine transport system permease protein